MTIAIKNVWDLLEEAPDYVENLSALISWSTNYNYQTGMPYWAFLDLIGYSEEHYGGKRNEDEFTLDYASTELFAAALIEWGNRPQDVEDFIDQIENAEW